MLDGMVTGHASPNDPVPVLAQRAPDEARERPCISRGGPSLALGPPAAGGHQSARGSSAACIVNSGQKLKTPKILVEGSISMVGSGEECEPGGWVVSAVCPRCGHHVSLVKHGCGRIECPQCSKKWARRAAERSAARLWGALHAGVSKHKPRHITFDLDELSWDAAKARAEEIGCTGGILVLHPWRLKEEYRAMFEMMAERTGMNRYDIAKQSGIGMDAFRWSPHCHGMVYGRFKDVRSGSEIFEYRNIRRMNSQHSAEGALMYLFGHTFIPPGQNGKCYRYFGICSPQKLKPEWTGSCTDSLKCPECQAEMVTEDSGEIILYKRYIALGWHVVTRIRTKARGAPPPRAPRVPLDRPEPFQKWACS